MNQINKLDQRIRNAISLCLAFNIILMSYGVVKVENDMLSWAGFAAMIATPLITGYFTYVYVCYTHTKMVRLARKLGLSV